MSQTGEASGNSPPAGEDWDATDLWVPDDTPSTGDPEWYAFTYCDGAIRFINEETESSVWQNRDGITVREGQVTLEAHYVPAAEAILCVAAENVRDPPVASALYDADSLPLDMDDHDREERELVLRTLLSEWTRAEEGRGLGVEVAMEDAPALFDAVDDIPLARTREKDPDSRTPAEMLAVGLYRAAARAVSE